jgi:hypothetical protein
MNTNKISKLCTALLTIIQLVAFSDCPEVVMGGDNFLTIRERTDKFTKKEGLNSTEYSIYTYTKTGDFDLRWKIFATPCSRAFLDPNGKALILLYNISIRNNDEIFIKLYTEKGLLKEFAIKNFFEVENLQYTDRSFPPPNLILMSSDSFGICDKNDTESIVKSSKKKPVTDKLDQDKNYFYFLTSQNKLFIINLMDASVIYTSDE